MTVLARTKSGVGRIRRRQGPLGTARDAGTPTTRGAAGTIGGAGSHPGRRREAGTCEDEAVYSCECGFVFQAPVSTSVDCPHCGSSQAW
ncbi:MAG: hypothetical protein ACRDNJ_15800 [Solirubrobacteraceae bacterium]